MDLRPRPPPCSLQDAGCKAKGSWGSGAGPGNTEIPGAVLGRAPAPTRRAGDWGGGGGAWGSYFLFRGCVTALGVGGSQGAAAGVRAGRGGARRGHIWRFQRRLGNCVLGSPVPARRRP